MNKIRAVVSKYHDQIALAGFILILATAIYWLWDLNNMINETFTWCREQTEAFPLSVCGGIAERDIQRTYYLRMIVSSLVIYLSARMLLSISSKDK